MELTSTSFLVTLIVTTALAMLALLLLWNRIPGPGWVRWPARVLMTGLCQLTAICVVAASINGSYGLYSSWDDLLGTGTGQDASAMTGPPLGRARFIRGGDGTRSTYFRGSHSKLAGQVMVWTPPEYDAPGAEKTRFPVLMLLHGYPGSPRTWIDLGNMPGSLERLVRLGASHPFIVVIPELYPGGVNTDCTNTPRRKLADWLARDVPDLVARNFRTLRRPEGWGLMGVSTGAFCAAKLPLQYPKVFRAGAALEPDPLTGDPAVLSDPAVRERNSPMWLVAHVKNADTALFLATSAQDENSPPRQLAAFAEAAEGTGVRVKTLVRPRGGHNFQTWTGMYPDALGWLSTELSPPAATAASGAPAAPRRCCR
ncbi:alpha/beta hydrolase-fold protein [Streptomyces sp. APSN-46.1]|uniref:alpha/beta hydrolase n=1 Tax=Streptomyces sp. APSN-46.1 TaxID=2929049 RepID=UPI001FB307B0|nr:alpha/beta hydrolase-fold protein [Streptomyces sp. APSN-46.1]MCJ1676933.1 alpha/beta hydrolase-fold protein [Streptomyces sp. APSN-46.1]